MQTDNLNEFWMAGMLFLGFALGFVACALSSGGRRGKNTAAPAPAATPPQGVPQPLVGYGQQDPMTGQGLAIYERFLRQQIDQLVLEGAKTAAANVTKATLGAAPPPAPAAAKV